MGKWEQSTVGALNHYKGKSVNPLNTPDITYELYSVPSWDNNYPEIISGAEIGSTKQVVEKGDILLCKINPRINRVWVVEQHTEHPIIASSEWIIVRNKDIDGRYLSKYFQSPIFRDMLVSEQSGIGGSITRAQPKRVNNYPVSLPPLPVQQQIADVLDRASTLIEKRKAQIDKLDLLVKSQFIEMFGDPLTNPKGWEIGTIRDLVSDVKYGTSKPATEEGKYIYLRMNNITYEGSMDFSSLKFIDIDNKEIEKYIVRKGDVLFNRTNSKELVGKTAVFKAETPMIIAGYIIRVRTNEKAHPEYIAAFLNSRYGKITLLDMCKAIVGQANINAQELQDIKIPLIPISIQNEFAHFVEQVEAQKSLLRQSLAKLELNYKSLMQNCFRGRYFE